MYLKGKKNYKGEEQHIKNTYYLLDYFTEHPKGKNAHRKNRCKLVLALNTLRDDADVRIIMRMVRTALSVDFMIL